MAEDPEVYEPQYEQINVIDFQFHMKPTGWLWDITLREDDTYIEKEDGSFIFRTKEGAEAKVLAGEYAVVKMRPRVMNIPKKLFTPTERRPKGVRPTRKES